MKRPRARTPTRSRATSLKLGSQVDEAIFFFGLLRVTLGFAGRLAEGLGRRLARNFDLDDLADDFRASRTRSPGAASLDGAPVGAVIANAIASIHKDVTKRRPRTFQLLILLPKAAILHPVFRSDAKEG